MTTTFDLIQLPSIARYRRPNLIWSSSTLVSVETGIVDGTSGDATILFSDGNLRTETSASRYDMIITQNAVFNNASLGNNQGGLRTGSATSNTWYACYAVKCTQFPANWVLVADTVLPIPSNYATLNTNFGFNSWNYLGLIRYGDNDNFTSSIINFVQTGNVTILLPQTNAFNYGGGGCGIQMAFTSAASSLAYTYSAGTGSTNIANNISQVYWGFYASQAGASPWVVVSTQFNTHALLTSLSYPNTELGMSQIWSPASGGLSLTNSGSGELAIYIAGWTDNALGVGSNPLF